MESRLNYCGAAGFHVSVYCRQRRNGNYLISGRSSRQRKKINYSQSAHDDEDDEEDVEDIGDSDGSNDRVKVKTKVKKLTSKSTAKSKSKAIDPVETIDLLRSSDEEWDE